MIDRIWETGQTTMAERLVALESFNISDRLWSIGAPTLVLAGARDVIVPAPRQRALAREITGARLRMIEEAGHIGFLTHRTEVVRLRAHAHEKGERGRLIGCSAPECSAREGKSLLTR